MITLCTLPVCCFVTEWLSRLEKMFVCCNQTNPKNTHKLLSLFNFQKLSIGFWNVSESVLCSITHILTSFLIGIINDTCFLTTLQVVHMGWTQNALFQVHTLHACCSQSEVMILKIRNNSTHALFLYNCIYTCEHRIELIHVCVGFIHLLHGQLCFVGI